LTGSPEIVRRLLPKLGGACVVGETLDVLTKAIAVKALDCINYPPVQLATLLVQQTAICHFVS